MRAVFSRAQGGERWKMCARWERGGKGHRLVRTSSSTPASAAVRGRTLPILEAVCGGFEGGRVIADGFVYAVFSRPWCALK